MSVKYAILYKIEVTNMALLSHGSDFTYSLYGLLYQIGTCGAFDLGEYAFKQFVKPVESYVVKLPISFLSLIYGILSG